MKGGKKKMYKNTEGTSEIIKKETPEETKNQNNEKNEETIEKLYFYSNFFERCKVPFISKLLSLCEHYHLNLKSKDNLESIHIAGLSFILQSIKGMLKNTTYAEIIQKINGSQHDEKEFLLNFRLFATILGVQSNKQEDDYRREFIDNQITLLGKEVNNELFPETKEELNQKIEGICECKKENPQIKINLQFIIDKYEESFNLLKNLVFNLYNYVQQSIMSNMKNVGSLLHLNKITNLLSSEKLKNNSIVNYSKDKISKLSEIFYLNELCQQFDTYKPYILDTKAIHYLGDLYNNIIIKPFGTVKIYIHDSYVKIKNNYSKANCGLKNYIILIIKQQANLLKTKYGEFSVIVKEKAKSIVLVIKKEYLNESGTWILNLLNKLKELDYKQTLDHAKETVTNIYQKWLLCDENKAEEEKLAESIEIEMDDINEENKDKEEKQD